MLKMRLFAFSFLMLFTEMALIRFIPGNIKVYGYFGNLVLIASFMGIGFGFLLSRLKQNLILLFPLVITALLTIVTYSQITIGTVNGGMTLLNYFSDDSLRIESAGSLILIFILVTAVFVLLGQAAGKLFTKLTALSAYSIDIGGSVAGVAAFSLLSYLSVSATYWFLVIFIVYMALVWKKKYIYIISALILISCLIFLKVKEDTTAIWSPYYKITYAPVYDEQKNFGYIVMVNNIVHQFIGPSANREAFYYYPYTLFPDHSYKNILVIGAGNGVDAAIALSKDPEVTSIDAVEIDPEIYKLGQKLNPDMPYDNPKVHAYIEDGRGFLDRTDKKYDLIIYGETDSVILVNNSSGVRLESFLYTTDAFNLVKKHLSENGVFFLFNYYRDDWVINKLAAMTQEVFGYPPYMITTGDTFKSSTIINGPMIKGINGSFPGLTRYQPGGKVPLPSDNWPYLYLRQMSIPVYYLNILLVLGLVTIAAYLILLKFNSVSGFDFRFAAFGVAFMLLETKSLINFAQLFGTTWIVNSLVTVAILLFILLANYINSKVNLKNLNVLYLLLFILLAAQLFIPGDVFSGLNIFPRYFAASAFYLSPVFVANLIFARFFKNSKDSVVSFGSNILGAVLGGFLEYTAMLTGYTALTYLIILAYILTLFRLRPRLIH